MKEKPLTDKQADLLSAIKSGVRVLYMPYMGRFNPNPYYYRTDTFKNCTVAANGLLRRGLVKRINESFGGHDLAAV